MAEIITEKVPVGISACVFSCPVRYNGKSFDALRFWGASRRTSSSRPLCPECMAGLGVPRMPIHLTGTGPGGARGRGARARPARPRSSPRRSSPAAEAAMETLERAGVDAFIAKEASPTCGLYKARVGKRRTETAGAAASSARCCSSTAGSSSPTRGSPTRCCGGTGVAACTRGCGCADRETQSATSTTRGTWSSSSCRRPTAPSPTRWAERSPRCPRSRCRGTRGAARRDARRAAHAVDARRASAGALWKTYAHARKKGQLDGSTCTSSTVDSPEVHANLTTVVTELTGSSASASRTTCSSAPSPVIRRDAQRVAHARQSGPRPQIPRRRNRLTGGPAWTASTRS